MCKHCWDDGETAHHKDFIRGGVDVSDFDEPRYVKARRNKDKRKSKKTYPGCPGNDNGPHIYVWTEEFEDNKMLFYRYFGYNEYQKNVCAGCGKQNGRKHSDKYEKRKRRMYDKIYPSTAFNVSRGEPVSRWGRSYRPSYRWWNWENHDEGWMKFRKDYISVHGYNSYVWGF